MASIHRREGKTGDLQARVEALRDAALAAADVAGDDRAFWDGEAHGYECVLDVLAGRTIDSTNG